MPFFRRNLAEISQLDMVFASNAKFPRCSKTPEVKLVIHTEITPPKSKTSPTKWPLQQRSIVFQSLFFKGHVSLLGSK